MIKSNHTKTTVFHYAVYSTFTMYHRKRKSDGKDNSFDSTVLVIRHGAPNFQNLKSFSGRNMAGWSRSNRRRSADGERAEAGVAGWEAGVGAAAGEAPAEKEPRTGR